MSANVSAASNVFRVDEMTCDHCKASIEGAVSPLEGVTAVEVDLDTKLVTVAGGEVDQVVAAMDDVGFDAVPVTA